MDLIVVGPDDETFLLKLLNTTPVAGDEIRDNLTDLTTARQWMVDRGIPPTRAELRNLRAARDALQSVVRGDTAPVDLQRYVAAVSLRPAADGDGLMWNLGTAKGSSGATRAVLAWDALRIGSPGRLRPCENPDCRQYLLDRSKPNNGRWCSMAVCGNRMKARRHYRRRASE